MYTQAKASWINISLASVALILSACGNRGNNTPTNGIYTNGILGNNGQVTNFAATGSGALDIRSGTIPFTIQGAQSSTNRIVGGALPSYGQMIGQAFIGSANGIVGTQMVGIGAFGNRLDMQYAYSGMGLALTGLVQLSQSQVQYIQQQIMSGMLTIPGLPITGNFMNQPLMVTSIGIDLNYYGNVLYNGTVYLLMNGTSHGYALSF